MSGEQWGEATRAPMRRFALASITAHLYPNEANAVEQEAAARAVLELIVADTRRKVAEEITALPCCDPDRDLQCCCCDELRRAAAIARGSGNDTTHEEDTK